MYRLIYRSRSVAPIDWPSVLDILETSRSNNLALEVSGVLLTTRSHYLQVLEGRYEDVNQLFMHIVRDERHTDIELIDFNIIDARLFRDWGMRGIGVFNLNKELEQSLVRKYGEENGSLHFPREAWLVLSLINDLRMTGDLPEWKR